MKALIRGNEIITEPFSDWVIANMKWLTGEEVDPEGKKLPGDGWTLIEDYHPPEATETPDTAIETEGMYNEPPKTENAVNGEEDGLIEIDGKKYTREELLRLLM